MVFFLIIRFGVFLGDEYYPAATTDYQGIITRYFDNQNSIGIFAILPELLFLIEIGIICGIDLLYYGLIDRTKSLLGN